MDKICIECGDIVRGRSDAKFCSASCRSAYHNRKSFAENANLIRKINRILKKNRGILKELNPDGKAKATRADLDKRGFNFNYFTNIYETKNGKSYYFCYDMGYMSTGDDWFVLVTKYEYI